MSQADRTVTADATHGLLANDADYDINGKLRPQGIYRRTYGAAARQVYIEELIL